MARGMAAGEAIVSQAQSKAFDEGYEAAGLGVSVAARQRGRFAWDPERKAMVPISEYRGTPQARNAPIIADRIHEGTKYDDGSRVWDLGSRQKRRRFMRETGVAERSDYGDGWRERRRGEMERERDKSTAAAMDRAARKLHNAGKKVDL